MPRLRTAFFIAGLITAIGAAPGAQTVQVRLYPLAGSSERGTATISQRGTDVIVNISLLNAAGSQAQYAHLHRGTCEHVAAPTTYILHTIRNGHSTTRLPDVTIGMFARGTYSILIHATSSANSKHVACGTISGA